MKTFAIIAIAAIVATGIAYAAVATLFATTPDLLSSMHAGSAAALIARDAQAAVTAVVAALLSAFA